MQVTRVQRNRSINIHCKLLLSVGSAVVPYRHNRRDGALNSAPFDCRFQMRLRRSSIFQNNFTLASTISYK